MQHVRARRAYGVSTKKCKNAGILSPNSGIPYVALYMHHANQIVVQNRMNNRYPTMNTLMTISRAFVIPQINARSSGPFSFS
jgi:hypothetical protein